MSIPSVVRPTAAGPRRWGWPRVVRVVSSLLLLLAPTAVQAQGPRETPIISPVYFATFRDFYEGDYRNAHRGYQQALRRAIRTVDTRWIDSICYATLLGEVHLRMGQMPEALQQYDAAMRLYVQYSDWMLRVQFPDTIGPSSAIRRPPPWGQSRRRAVRGRFPDTFNMLRGGQRVVTVNGKQTVANVQKLHALHVDELVRCTALAMRRRAELLGPLAKHDKLTQAIIDKASARQGPPNHWSGVWLDLQQGSALAAAGKLDRAVPYLKRSILAGGEFDHPLSCVAMLALGRIALDQANYKEAIRWLEEASYSAFAFDRPEVVQESLQHAGLAHMMMGNRTIYAPALSAAAWANTRRLDEMQASLLTSATENYALVGDLKKAQAMLGQATRALGRRDLSRSIAGAQLNYVTAVVKAFSHDMKGAKQALNAAMDFQRTGSVRLFQIKATDNAFVKGNIRERVAVELFAAVLSDPAPIVWRHTPLEALAQLLVPHPVAMEHWFAAATRREDVPAALEIVDQTRRQRFTQKLPMGGRLLNLRWVMQAPEDALPQEALLQRNDLAGRYPAYTGLQKKAAALVDALRQQPLLPEDAGLARDQAQLLTKLAKVSGAADNELHKIAISREPVMNVFPPQRTVTDIQKQLPTGHAILMFHSTRKVDYAFLITGERIGAWKIASPASVKKKTIGLLRAMGHFDQGRALDLEQLSDTSWKAASVELLSEIMMGSKIDLGQGIEELTIVPDGLYWYVPFESLQVGTGPGSRSLLSQMKIRYAPTLGLAVSDGRGRSQSGEYIVIQGRLYPREDESVGIEAVRRIRQAVPRVHAVTKKLLAPGSPLAALIDGLVVWDDLEGAETNPLALAPFQVDKGRPESTIDDWMGLPWGGPEVVVLPGFHTPAENALKRLGTVGRPGNELFLTTMGLLATGSRTIVISRWRTGGRTAANLIGEFLQELSGTTAQDAWQRSVQIAREAIVDPDFEPRVKGTNAAVDLKSTHPFFWGGYLVIDSGIDGKQNGEPPKRPALKFPK